jgi:hypothetical protein
VVLRFPDDRRVPPPDFTGTRVRRASLERVTVCAIVHPGARLVTAAPISRRHEPATRAAPRTLAFEHRQPPPGSVERAASPAQNIRAIVHAKALEPVVVAPRRSHAPAAPGKPRRLAFAVTVSAPRSRDGAP